MKDDDFTVTVVDDDESVLKAVSRLLRSAGWKTVTFASPAAFLAAYDAGQTGCLIIDLAMPELSGLEVQRAIQEQGGAPPILFLSGTGDIPDSVRAMKQGAIDFLTKPIDERLLLDAIQAACEHESAARQERLELIDIRCRLKTLTPREREVFEHVVSGRLNKQIAAELGTVESTIKVHRARVMEKMRAESLAELVLLAKRMGIQTAPAH